MKALLSLLAAALASTSLAATATTPIQLLIPGSDAHDFGILCREGKDTNYLVDKNKNNGYRYARNIVFTEMGGGRVAITYLHGRSTANEEATYLAGPHEKCEAYRQ